MDTAQTDRLARALLQKQECLQRLRDLGLQQLDYIAAGAMEQLLTLLAGKQRLIQRLQEIERDLDPFRHDALGDRAWRSDEIRQACERLVANCQSLLQEVWTHERLSEQQMVLRRDETGRQLHALSEHVQARDAYGAGGAPLVGQVDLTTE